jgi:hypothetical protein
MVNFSDESSNHAGGVSHQSVVKLSMIWQTFYPGGHLSRVQVYCIQFPPEEETKSEVYAMAVNRLVYLKLWLMLEGRVGRYL